MKGYLAAKEIRCFNGIRRCSTAFTKYIGLYRASWIHSKIFSVSSAFLYTRTPVFSWGIRTNILYAYLVFHIPNESRPWSKHYNNITLRTRIVKVLIMQFIYPVISWLSNPWLYGKWK